MGHLANYYEEVFLSAHGADTVFIFGPGEAKGELRKQFQKRHFSERIVGFESANKMTPRQVSEKLPKLLSNYTCHSPEERRLSLGPKRLKRNQLLAGQLLCASHNITRDTPRCRRRPRHFFSRA